MYEVRPISNDTARDLIAGHHYAGDAHPVIQRAFGLFRDGLLVGAVTFGPPVDRSTAIWADYELNRLALTDNRRNEASRLIAGAVRLLGPVSLISYADPSRSHDGAIYRASNWNYHGLSRPSTRKRNGKWYRTGGKHRYSLGAACPWPVVPFVPLTEAQTRKLIINGYGGRRGTATAAERSKVYRARQGVRDKRSCDQCGTSYTPQRRTSRYCGTACRVRAHRTTTTPTVP